MSLSSVKLLNNWLALDKKKERLIVFYDFQYEIYNLIQLMLLIFIHLFLAATFDQHFYLLWETPKKETLSSEMLTIQEITNWMHYIDLPRNYSTRLLSSNKKILFGHRKSQLNYVTHRLKHFLLFLAQTLRNYMCSKLLQVNVWSMCSLI